MEANVFVTLPPKCIEFPQNSMVKICLRNNSDVTISLLNTSNLGEYVLYGANNKIENVWRVYLHSRSI